MKLKEVEQHFNQLLNVPLDQRNIELEKLRLKDVHLAERVAQLLAESDTVDDFLCKPILPDYLQPLRHLQDWVHTEEYDDMVQIGPYQVTGVLGRGGMGVVYLGERLDGLRKRVAIKVIRSSRQSDELVLLFEQEQRTMARLEHEHIARFYDAGQTVDGFPYFTMEFVDGSTLMKYCSDMQLGLRIG